MYRILEYFFLIIGAFAVIIGLIPFYVLFTAGNLGCSDALSFAHLAGGVALLASTYIIGKRKPRIGFLLVALVLAFGVASAGQYLVQWSYGVSGNFDACNFFVG